jgi:hypothetical protein
MRASRRWEVNLQYLTGASSSNSAKIMSALEMLLGFRGFVPLELDCCLVCFCLAEDLWLDGKLRAGAAAAYINNQSQAKPQNIPPALQLQPHASARRVTWDRPDIASMPLAKAKLASLRPMLPSRQAPAQVP